MIQRKLALSSKRGYTLIEVMVALSILAIVAVALMKSSLLVMQTNIQNEIRDEAVRVGEEIMNAIRNSPAGFDAATPTANHLDLFVETYDLPTPVVRTMRGGTVQYTIRKRVAWVTTPTTYGSFAQTNKQITVTVNWLFRNVNFSHTMTSIVGRY